MGTEMRANAVWSDDGSLLAQPLKKKTARASEKNAAGISEKNAADMQYSEWRNSKTEKEIRHIMAIGVEELEDLEWGGHYRQSALQEIWENANNAFCSFLLKGYDWEEALRLARAEDCKELDYLNTIDWDVNGLLRYERRNAFDEIERREKANADRRFTKAAQTETEPVREENEKKKFQFPWQKKRSAGSGR